MSSNQPPTKPNNTAPSPSAPKTAAQRAQNRAVLKTALITVGALFILIGTAAVTFFVVDRTNIDHALTHDLVSAVSSRWNKLKETAGVTEFAVSDHVGDAARFSRLLSDYEQAVYFLGGATGLRDPEIRAAYDAFRPVSDAAIANIHRTNTLTREDAQRVDVVLRDLVRIAYRQHTGNELADVCDEACILAQRSRDEQRRVAVTDLISTIRLHSTPDRLAPDPALISEFANTNLDLSTFRDPTTNSVFSFIGWSPIHRRDPDVGIFQYGGLGTTCNAANNIIAGDPTSIAIRTRLEDSAFYCHAINLGP